ncbi:MAG: sensor histidine kinase, partial [Verrucomicrobium sp.]|nr:sensor histidine kinase [Verrucomicrobium sp.]
WLRSPADVVILGTPSWWTPVRLTAALISALVVLLLAGAWISALSRAVRRRTERIEEMMRLHRDTELEFQAALRERQRLAADLHDGLQQMIAGATFRLEAAVDQLPEISPEAAEELTAARRALLHTQTGLRDCVWGLRNVEEGPHDFAGLLRHAVGSIEHWPGGSVRVETQGEPVELSRDVMGNLLLLMQEGVANAFRHGQAAEVLVSLEYGDEELELRIEDNGRGFIVSAAPGTKKGHFGLEGMRERMQRLGGTVQIASKPGSGTRITVRLPLGKARATTLPSAHTLAVNDGSLLLPVPAPAEA